MPKRSTLWNQLTYYTNSHENSDLHILTGRFGITSSYGDTSNSSYAQLGHLVVVSFHIKTNAVISNGNISIGQMVAKDSNPPQEGAFFVATAPNALSYPCELSQSGDIIIMNYAGDIPAETQLFAQFSYLAQNAPS